MDSNIVSMILVLGGTLIVGMTLLYFSLKTGLPPRRAQDRRAAEATAVMMASNRDA